jgi:hypothetical protein
MVVHVSATNPDDVGFTSFSTSTRFLGLAPEIVTTATAAALRLTRRTSTALELVEAGMNFFAEHPEHPHAPTFKSSALGMVYSSTLSRPFYRALFAEMPKSEKKAGSSAVADLVSFLRSLLHITRSHPDANVPE